MARRGRKSGLRIGPPSGAARHQRPWLIPLLATVAILVVLGGAGLAIVALQSGSGNAALASAGDGSSPLPKASIATSDGVDASSTAGSVLASGTMDVEVPDVVGKSLTSAEMILQAAGFITITRVASRPLAGVTGDQVLAQTPAGGTRMHFGDAVIVTYNPVAGAFTDESFASQPVVVIDPGHQAKADLSLEPIGPGSPIMKEKVKGGATGVATHVPEYRQVLAISLRLRDALQARGVTVIMIRTIDDVNVANSQRAIIGNKAGAALTIRIHCDSNANSSVRGTSTLYPSGNSWVRTIEAPSKRAANIVQAATVRATGAGDRGLFPRSDMSGFNYSTVPTIIVECGFMSNAAEDRLLATSAYQDKLAAGLAAGVLEYIGR
jgi:N-acetylmuramoyl-L-alanine amidase